MKLFIANFITLLVAISIVSALRHKKGRHRHNYYQQFHGYQAIIPWRSSVEDNEDAKIRDFENDRFDYVLPENYAQRYLLEENARRRDNLGFLGSFDDIDLHNFIRHKIEEKLDKNVDGDPNTSAFFNLKDKILNKKGSKKRKKKNQSKHEIPMSFDDPELFADDVDPQEDETDNAILPGGNIRNGKSKMHRQLQSMMGKKTYESPLVQQQTQENVPGSQIKLKLAVGTNNPLTPVPIATVADGDEVSGSGSETEYSGENNSGEIASESEAIDNNQALPENQIPQDVNNQIQATHTNTAIGQTYPNFPVPPMIPIPIFYSSGDGQGSGTSGMNEVKPSADMTAGESGYGENTDQIQNNYASGDWVERAINKEKGHDDDDEDELDEEERWMGKKERKLNNPSLSNSPLKNADYQKQQEQRQSQLQQQQLQQQQQKQQQQQRYQQDAYYTEYEKQQLANRYPQQYPGYFPVTQQSYAPQNQYTPKTLQQTYTQNQAASQPKQSNFQLKKQQEDVSSAAAVSAASASYQQKLERTWEQQPASVNTVKQGSYTLTQTPALVEQAPPQQTTFSWDNFQTQQDGVMGECVETCPATCAPSCDAECCSRGVVEERKKESAETTKQGTDASSMPEFNEIIAASNQQAQQPVQGLTQSGSESISQMPSSTENQFSSDLPGTTLTLPDVTIGPNGASQEVANVPNEQTNNVAAVYSGNSMNQGYSQQNGITAMDASRFNIENQQASTFVQQQQQQFSPEVSQPGSAAGTINMFQNMFPQENPPLQAAQKLINVRPFDAPPPVANINNPMPADVNRPVATAQQLTETKNFALKPLQPILLKVPSIVHVKKEEATVRYPNPQCMKICETKCMPFCQNSCCGIPAERKRKRNKIVQY